MVDFLVAICGGRAGVRDDAKAGTEFGRPASVGGEAANATLGAIGDCVAVVWYLGWP